MSQLLPSLQELNAHAQAEPAFALWQQGVFRGANVMCDETMNSIAVTGQRLTLTGVTVNRKARHQGSSRPAEIAPIPGRNASRTGVHLPIHRPARAHNQV